MIPRASAWVARFAGSLRPGDRPITRRRRWRGTSGLPSLAHVNRCFPHEGPPSPAVTNDAPPVFPLGETTVTWTATDASGNSATATQKVTVVDTPPPAIGTVSANPAVLHPANHKLVDVTVSAALTDICDAAPTWRIVAVTCNQPVNGAGDGNTDPDWVIAGNHVVRLRAERSGRDGDRVYTIAVEAVDASGNTASGSVGVTVPHDQGQGANERSTEREQSGAK